MAVFSSRLTGWVIFRDILALATAYINGLLFLPRPVFLEILNGVLVTLCFAVCVVFFPSIVDFWKKGITGVLLMRIAIAGAWAFQLMQAIGRIYFLEFNPQVTGRTFDALYGLPAVGYIIFAAMHIVAIGMIDTNNMVRRNVCIILWSIIGGVVGTGALMWLHRL